MFDVVGKTVSISRQDVGSFTITFTGADKPADGVKVIFTVKRTPEKYAEVLLSKELEVSDSAIEINLSTEETDLPPGEYYWDIRILYETDEPFTPMQPALFIVLGVVGDV